ncbi:hypothetical protein TKK_0010989 [Trichogramma kaykai]
MTTAKSKAPLSSASAKTLTNMWCFLVVISLIVVSSDADSGSFIDDHHRHCSHRHPRAHEVSPQLSNNHKTILAAAKICDPLSACSFSWSFFKATPKLSAVARSTRQLYIDIRLHVHKRTLERESVSHVESLGRAMTPMNSQDHIYLHYHRT